MQTASAALAAAFSIIGQRAAGTNSMLRVRRIVTPRASSFRISLCVLAERGHCAHGGGACRQIVRRQERGDAARRRIDLDPAAARGKLRMRGDVGNIVHRAVGDSGRVEPAQDLGARCGRRSIPR